MTRTRMATRWAALASACLLLALLSPSNAGAEEPADTPHAQDHVGHGHGHHGPGPTAHAPLGVMGDHTHGAGGVMLSYRFGFMNMDGNRDGTSDRSTADVLRDFPVAPTRMETEMHMFGAMWAPVDQVTLSAMVPYLRKEMDHRTRMGTSFTTKTDGLGDIRVGALVPLVERESGRLHANLILSLPTGSTTEKGRTPMGKVRLPYPMQLGSGTWDLLPGVTWQGAAPWFDYGSQLNATLRTGRNNQGYRLGHAYQATGWIAREILPWLSASLRLDWQQWFDIEGQDDALNPRVVPTADPDLRAGRRLDLLIGVNLLGQSGFVRGHRLAVEFGMPLYQSLDGPQLETDWRVVTGWQYAF